MKFIVTDSKGLLIGGQRIPKGSALPASVSGSQLIAWKRFGQVKEAQEKTEKPSKQDGPENPDKGSPNKPGDPDK